MVAYQLMHVHAISIMLISFEALICLLLLSRFFLQEEIHFLASLGNFQESMPPGNPESGATFLQRYMEVTHIILQTLGCTQRVGYHLQRCLACCLCSAYLWS